MRQFQIPLILILWCIGVHATAQVQQLDPEQKLGSSTHDSIPEGIVPLDTPVPMTYILIEDPGTPIAFMDTFIWEDNRHNPNGIRMAHLGNYGSAARPLDPASPQTIGFNTGWFQFDSSYVHESTFRYYNQDVPVARIKYSQASQENTYLTLDFGRSFARGLNLSVKYKRINQVGEFAHQRQKNTGFSIGLWHDAPSGKYDAFYNYLNNSSVTQENGGVAEPSLIGQDDVPDASIPIHLTTNLNTAINTHKQRTFMTKQILHLLRDNEGIGMDIWLKGAFKTGLFKYADEDAALSGDYYSDLFFNDDRGIRQYTHFNENEWSAGIALPWAAAHSIISGAIRYRGIQLEQEPITRKISELYLDATGRFQWIEPLILEGDFTFGFGQAEGVFAFRADATLSTGKLGLLKGYWSATSRKPYMIESSLYVTQEPVYLQEFENPFVNEIGVSWEVPDQLFTAGIEWLVFDQYIYFDSLRLPQQIDQSFSLRRLYASKGFDFKSFGFKASGFWQPDPKAELAVPEYWFTSSVYGRIPIFKRKVMLMPGMDATYNGGFTGISYFPVNAVYHLTNGPVIPEAFSLDIALGVKINFIEAFIRLDDCVGLFKDRALYQADFYPHYRGYFRFGFEAGFYN